MTRQSVTLVLVVALLSISALAQTGATQNRPAGAANPQATTPARPAPAPGTQATPAPATPTSAAPAAAKVGVINFNAAIALCNEGQRDFGALQKKFEPKQAELQNLSKELEDLKKQLTTQSDKMNDEARANLSRTVEQKQKTLQRSLEDARTEFQTQQNEIAERIYRKLGEVLVTYARNNNFSLVLKYDESDAQNPLLWWQPTVDITQDVIAAYNAVSGVPAPPPAAPSAARPAGGTGTTAAAPQQPRTGTGATTRNPQ
ncbi:MAG TPA: OmpH family outer membrane protein [Terriglobales bacterium]|nr:OmpH family outer membrane protein [Terriglobales bacterium]